MTTLASSRHGIPRGGLKVTGDNFASRFDARPSTQRGRLNDSPSV